MATFVDVLMEMGFDKNRAEKALKETGNVGVETAMEWLITHEAEVDDGLSNPGISDATTSATTSANDTTTSTTTSTTTTTTATTTSTNATTTSTNNATSPEAKALKCEDCGKMFPGVTEAEYHATKTGHSNFSETTESIKPLTEEEKQEQLLKVQELLKQRRLEREEKERGEQLEREKSRRNMGKEMLQAKQKLQELEMKKILDQRKRDKEEERAAKQRVREQIEKDKKDRELKFGGLEKTEQETLAQSQPTTSPPQQPTTTTTHQQQPTKDYIETRLQIRLLNGEKLTESFGVNESLAAVRLFVQQRCSQLMNAHCSFMFTTTFPKKDYLEDDMQMTLKDLGLVPSAVLIVKKI